MFPGEIMIINNTFNDEKIHLFKKVKRNAEKLLVKKKQISLVLTLLLLFINLVDGTVIAQRHLDGRTALMGRLIPVEIGTLAGGACKSNATRIMRVQIRIPQ